MKVRDVTGQRFGRLIALARVGAGRAARWQCRCDCGKVTLVSLGNLGRVTKSCGCFRRDACRARERKKNYHPLLAAQGYYKRNARVRGVPWELPFEVFVELCEGACHYCGVRPGPNGVDRVMAGRNGVDRVQSERGYVSGNCVSCCRACNTAKTNLGIRDFRLWVQRLHDTWVSNGFRVAPRFW